MSFLKNLFSSTPAQPDKKYLTFQVKCNRCGETLEGRVDLDNDLRRRRRLFRPQRIDGKQPVFSTDRSLRKGTAGRMTVNVLYRFAVPLQEP